MLFEPEHPQGNDFDDEMIDTSSMHTNVGSKAYEKGGGIAINDPKLM